MGIYENQVADSFYSRGYQLWKQATNVEPEFKKKLEPWLCVITWFLIYDNHGYR
jgi:hypothetical protein